MFMVRVSPSLVAGLALVATLLGHERSAAAACTASTCLPSDTCHTAACSAGTCVQTAKANGTACSDANACTTAETCQSGACVVPGNGVDQSMTTFGISTSYIT